MDDRQYGWQGNYPSSSQQPPLKKARSVHDEDVHSTERNISANPYDYYGNQQIDTHKSNYQMVSQFPLVHQRTDQDEPIRTSNETSYHSLHNSPYDPQFSQQPIQQSRWENLQQTSFCQPHQTTMHYGYRSEQTIPGGNAGYTHLPQEHPSQMPSDQEYSSRLSFPSQHLTTSQEAISQPLDLSLEQNYDKNYATNIQKGEELTSDNDHISLVEIPPSPVSCGFPDDWKTMRSYEKLNFCWDKKGEARRKGDRNGDLRLKTAGDYVHEQWKNQTRSQNSVKFIKPVRKNVTDSIGRYKSKFQFDAEMHKFISESSIPV